MQSSSNCKDLLMAVMIFALAFVLIFGSASQANAAAYSYSFENGMQGWNIDGTDLEIGDDFIDWDIGLSKDRAYSGFYSLKYYLENNNDAGKIRIITGVNNYDPEVRSDLTYQGNTYNGGKKDYTWLSKNYSFTVKSTASGVQ